MKFTAKQVASAMDTFYGPRYEVEMLKKDGSTYHTNMSQKSLDTWLAIDPDTIIDYKEVGNDE